MERNAGMVSMFSGDRTMVMGGNFTQITQPSQLNHARMLLGQCIAEGARHDSAERYSAPTCHPNTRRPVIKDIMTWIKSPLDSDEPKIKWLSGDEGVGKSVIMQTVAVICANEGTLGGSFFFKRSDLRRGVATHLVSTLAYQLLQTVPEVRPYIEAAVDLDPMFFSLSLLAQFIKLILTPLRTIVHQLSRPVVILIDGLDECSDHKTQKYIISLLVAISRDSRLPSIPFRFLIASRRKSHILSAMSSAQALASTSPLPFTEIELTRTPFIRKILFRNDLQSSGLI
ncbi:hypothetical protein BJ165DRAFT_657904 [Panaeolus papilionaceus]|nr:hypothetical protein BJ165DRAFT_657904 [Panaeolus papilionaceus]